MISDFNNKMKTKLLKPKTKNNCFPRREREHRKLYGEKNPK